jgi:hypothetical protein
MDIEATGALATAALVAHAIEGENQAAGSAHGARASVCANCAAPVDGAYCSACGQRVHLHRSILHMGEEFLHGLLHFDAKAWRTLPMLAVKPGHLTRDYIAGQRTRYVSPLALFLFMMFLMFFVVSATLGVRAAPTDAAMSQQAVRMYKAELARAEGELAAARVSGDGVELASGEVTAARADLAEAERLFALAAAGLPAAGKGAPVHTNKFDVTTGIAALDGPLKEASKNPDLIVYKLKSAAAKFTFLLVPLSLPFLWLMFFWRPNVTMYDHAVFVLYSMCFMALLVMAVSVLKFFGFKMAALLCFALAPVHMFLQLRHAYGLRLWGTTWRTATLALASVCVLMLYLVAILALTVRP